jgi:hypothetical protein
MSGSDNYGIVGNFERLRSSTIAIYFQVQAAGSGRRVSREGHHEIRYSRDVRDWFGLSSTVKS